MPIAVAVGRDGHAGQNERRRSSIAEASPMSGVEDGAEGQPPQPKHRSLSARRRQSQSPTKSRDGRGRTTDKPRHQKKGSQLSSMLAAEPTQSSSKAASSADKGNQQSSAKHDSQSSKDSTKQHVQEEQRHQSRTSARSRSSSRTIEQRGHKDRSPVRHRRDSSQGRQASSASTPPPKSTPRRRVVLTPSPEPEPYVIRITTKEAKKPTVTSQIVVPERTRSASTGLRVIVPQEQTSTFKEPRLPARSPSHKAKA